MASRNTVWQASKDVPVRAKGSNWSSLPRQGAPERTRLTVGRRNSRLHRAFIDFSVDQSDIGVVHKATLVLHTNDTDYGNGNNAKVRIYRVTKNFGEGTGTRWQNDESINPSVATGKAWAKAINQVTDGETRIDVTPLVGQWLTASRRWLDSSGKEQPGAGRGRHGIRLQAAYRETDWQRGFSVWSKDAADSALRPRIEVEYEPPNYAPDVISTIEPNGTVLPDQPFSGEFGDPNGDKPHSIKVQVRKKSNQDLVWNEPAFPFSNAWIDQGGMWLWSIDNPGSARLKSDIEYEWRAKGFDGRGKDSGWTEWRTFTQSGVAPTVSPRALGTRDTLVGTRLEADWVVEEAIVSYRVQLKNDTDLWTDPLWDQTFLPVTAEELRLGHIRFQYRGPGLAAGDYDWRVLAVDSRGVSSPWSSADRFTLLIGSEEDLDDGSDALPPNTTGFARAQTKIRIVLRDTDGANRGPGTVKAIIEDAHNVGFSAITNEPGEFFFTLTALHPQAGECEPFQRHYALQMYRNGAWKDIANGLLTDFDAGEDDVIVYGLDYLGMLSRSIDTRFPPPGTNLNASHNQGGAKYKNKTISHIITDQLTEAKNDTDAPLSFFNLGTIHTLSTKVSIYSSFKQRLDFIRGLLDSHRQGSGKRTRLKARKDPSQNDRWEWDLRNQPGVDRDNLRLEYGSVLQGFRVIAMGEDYATRTHGVGTEPDDVKPKYFVWPPVGDSDFLTQTFGNLQRVEVWPDLVDRNDLKRRVKQLRKEDSKVGKRVRLAIKVHSMQPFDGYDLTDNFPLDIDRGLVETDRYGSGYWTIWGVEWRLFPDGHDELTWAVKPREDDETPDADLIPSDPIHEAPEWVLGEGPPVEPAFSAARYYMDKTTGDVYIRPATTDENDGYGWVIDTNVPAIPPPPGGWYPGDQAAPDPPTGFVVTSEYREDADGTAIPAFVAAWTDAAQADIIGYEVEWDRTELDDGDPPAPIPATFVNPQSSRFGVGVGTGALEAVIGGDYYGFRIRSYDMEGLVSPWVTHPETLAQPDGSAPDIPEGLEAVPGYRLVGAKWGASSAADLSFYEFRYKAKVHHDYEGPFKAKSNRVVIDGLVDKTQYEVQVRAVDRSGNVRVSGDPGVGDEVIANYQSDKQAGWSTSAFATTVLVGTDSIAFKTLIADFIDTGIISADQIFGGDLLLGSPGREGTIRIYDGQGRPTGAWGDFGWIIAAPQNPGRAIWSVAGAIYFTSQYDWDGTETRTTDQETGIVDVTAGIEQGIPTTTWTTAIDWKGINAESITFGSQFGGNNRLLNAGFELQDFDTAMLALLTFTDSTDWGSPVRNINMDVSGAELRMVTH